MIRCTLKRFRFGCAGAGRPNLLPPADALARLRIFEHRVLSVNLVLPPRSCSHRRRPSGDLEPLESLGFPYQISLTIAVNVEPLYHALPDGVGGLFPPRGLSGREASIVRYVRVAFRASCGTGPDSGGLCVDFASWAAAASPFAVGCALIELGLLLCSVMSGTRCKGAAFLVSPGARWMTGSTLRMDGGEVKSI